MPAPATDSTRLRLLQAASELFRRNGIAATGLADICAKAGVTKGAIFHHFASKEELTEACLEQWRAWASEREAAAPFHAIADPVARVLGYMDFYLGMFSDPTLLRSCLAGVAAQEVADSHPRLRDAANACFVGATARLQALLEEAGRALRRDLDARSLASLWIATIQGSLLLSKASGDGSVIRANLEHVKRYFARALAPADSTSQEIDS